MSFARVDPVRHEIDAHYSALRAIRTLGITEQLGLPSRNWALVKALLSDPSVEVQWIFVHRALADLMLREGPTSSDDPALVARAAALFHQPSDAQAHDDHMHVRVYCSPHDRAIGCVDRGPARGVREQLARAQAAGSLSMR